MRRLAAVLIAAAALGPAVIASAATADPGVSADPSLNPAPTPTPTPNTDCPYHCTPSPTPPTPTPFPPPGFHGDYPPPSPPRFTVTPDSPAPQNTVETLSATPQWQAPAGGTLRFTDNGAELTTATVGAHDTATFTVTLPPGQHTLTATFNGQCPAVSGPDSSIGCSYGTTSSATITYVVEATSTPTPTPTPGPLSTPPAIWGMVYAGTGLAVTPDSPAGVGTVETLNATVIGVVETGPIRGGYVQFFDNGALIGQVDCCTFSLTGSDWTSNLSHASLTTTLGPGTHTLTAMWGANPPTAGISPAGPSQPITYVVTDATPSPSPSPTPEPTLAVPIPTPPAGLTGPGLVLWQKLVTWLLGQLGSLGF